MFRFEGLPQFIKGIDDWLKSVENESVEVLRGIAVEAFFKVANETPQWTGNAASNWNLSVGSPDFSVSTELLSQYSDSEDFGAMFGAEFVGGDIKQKGDPEAVSMAVSYNAGRQYQIKSLDLPVYITNSAEGLNGEAYLQMLEENPGNFLRPENNPGHMVQNAVVDLSRGKLSSQTIEHLKGQAKLL